MLTVLTVQSNFTVSGLKGLRFLGFGLFRVKGL